MAVATELPIKLKSVKDYKTMSYNELLNCLNDLNAIERYIPHDLYMKHKAIVGSLMSNIQRRTAIAAYARQIADSEVHIAELEAALA